MRPYAAPRLMWMTAEPAVLRDAPPRNPDLVAVDNARSRFLRGKLESVSSRAIRG